MFTVKINKKVLFYVLNTFFTLTVKKEKLNTYNYIQ